MYAYVCVPRRIRRPPRRSLLPASSLFPPLLPSPVFQPRLSVRLAPPPTPLSSPPRSSPLPTPTWPSLLPPPPPAWCTACAWRTPTSSWGAQISPPTPCGSNLTVPRVAHMAEEPVVARRHAVSTPVMGEYCLHVYHPLHLKRLHVPGVVRLVFPQRCLHFT